MSSWRRSFEMVTQELDLTKRKKQALDELLEKKRVSQLTYEHLAKTLTARLLELEAHQGSLAGKMTGRANELDEQIGLFELVLAYLEIRHVGREIDEEIYAKNNETVTLGLEAARSELGVIRSSLTKILP